MLEYIVYLLMGGIGLCLIPLISGFRRSVSKCIYSIDFIVFSILGGLFAILYYTDGKNYIPLFAISFLFAIISLSAKIISLENVSYDKEKGIKFGDLSYRQKLRLVILPLSISCLILMSTIIFSVVSFTSGTLVEGDVFARNFNKIMSSPLITMMAVLASIGGMVKVVREDRAAMVVSNMLIVIFPLLMWLLTALGLVPIPNDILTLYGEGTEFIGRIVYLILFLVIIILITGVTFVFQNVKLMQS